MASLLNNKAPLVVNATLAKAIGLNEAIILEQVNYWLHRDHGGRIINGEKWIYNTVEEWQKQFPFWSEDTIARTLKNLENARLIKTGNFNRSAMDRTKWYTVNRETVALLDALITQEQELEAEAEAEGLRNAIPQVAEMEDGNLRGCNAASCGNIPETTRDYAESTPEASIENPPPTTSIAEDWDNLPSMGADMPSTPGVSLGERLKQKGSDTEHAGAAILSVIRQKTVPPDEYRKVGIATRKKLVYSAGLVLEDMHAGRYKWADFERAVEHFLNGGGEKYRKFVCSPTTVVADIETYLAEEKEQAEQVAEVAAHAPTAVFGQYGPEF